MFKPLIVLPLTKQNYRDLDTSLTDMGNEKLDRIIFHHIHMALMPMLGMGFIDQRNTPFANWNELLIH